MGRVLVTGGTGAIGSWVLRRLIEDRGERPVAFDMRDDNSLLSDLAGNYDFVSGDVRNLADLVRACGRFDVDRVVHLAAFLPTTEVANPVTAFHVNAVGTQNVLEAALASGVRRLVYTSSKGVFGSFTGVYGPPEYQPVTEDLPKTPVGMYDLSKLTSEHLLAFYHQHYGLDYAVLRFPLLYGPGRLARHGAVSTISRLVENAMAGVPTVMTTGADWEDEFLYNRDVAQGIVRALLAPRLTHRTYHVGRCRIERLEDVAAAVRLVLPEAQIELGPGTFRSEPRACRFDYSRASEDLGYEPEYDLRAGIADYVAFMQRLGVAPTVS